jgi:hypothetical protein
MGPYAGGLGTEGDVHPPPPGPEAAAAYHLDHDRANMTPSPGFQNGGGFGGGGYPPPLSSQHPSRPAGTGSPAPSTHSESRKSGERNRSRGRGRTTSGQIRICKKCGEPLTGQFVRALDGTFHLDCFKCRVCIPSPLALIALLFLRVCVSSRAA